MFRNCNMCNTSWMAFFSQAWKYDNSLRQHHVTFLSYNRTYKMYLTKICLQNPMILFKCAKGMKILPFWLASASQVVLPNPMLISKFELRHWQSWDSNPQLCTMDIYCRVRKLLKAQAHRLHNLAR